MLLVPLPFIILSLKCVYCLLHCRNNELLESLEIIEPKNNSYITGTKFPLRIRVGITSQESFDRSTESIKMCIGIDGYFKCEYSFLDMNVLSIPTSGDHVINVTLCTTPINCVCNANVWVNTNALPSCMRGTKARGYTQNTEIFASFLVDSNESFDTMDSLRSISSLAQSMAVHKSSNPQLSLGVNFVIPLQQNSQLAERLCLHFKDQSTHCVVYSCPLEPLQCILPTVVAMQEISNASVAVGVELGDHSRFAPDYINDLVDAVTHNNICLSLPARTSSKVDMNEYVAGSAVLGYSVRGDQRRHPTRWTELLALDAQQLFHEHSDINNSTSRHCPFAASFDTIRYFAGYDFAMAGRQRQRGGLGGGAATTSCELLRRAAGHMGSHGKRSSSMAYAWPALTTN